MADVNEQLAQVREDLKAMTAQRDELIDELERRRVVNEAVLRGVTFTLNGLNLGGGK